MKKTYFIIIIITTIFIGSLVFYWYELRPSKIRKQCSEEIENKDIPGVLEYRPRQIEYIRNPEKKINDYNDCLHRNGLE
jgi:hypothetical protein